MKCPFLTPKWLRWREKRSPHSQTYRNKKKTVLQQWQWIVFGSAKPAQDEKPKARRKMKSTNANPLPSWGYVGPILQQLAHPLLGLHVAILHCIKLNLTWRIFWLKMRLSSNMQIYQWNILFGWNKPTGDGNKRAMYVYVYICFFLHIDLFFYLFICLFQFIYLRIFKTDACISTYKHVLQHWQWTVFSGRQTSTEWREINIILNIF